MLSKAFASIFGGGGSGAAAAAAGSAWANLDSAPPDPILGLSEAFKSEKNPNKVLLGLGAFRDNAGKPYVLPCVKEA